MDLTKPAFNLFIAESTAQSLVGSVEVGGLLSAAFHMRHKIRETDIQSVLATCGSTPTNSYARVVGVAYLMAFASAAYAEVAQMIGSHNLAETQVTHHFGGQARALRLACVSEPMNLWSGWALENLKGNATTFDPHMITHLQGSASVIKVSLPSNASGMFPPSAPTQGQQVLHAYAPQGLNLQGAPIPSGFKPGLTRTMTPTSEGLAQMVKFDAYYQNTFNTSNLASVAGKSLAGSPRALHLVNWLIGYIATNMVLPTDYLKIVAELQADFDEVKKAVNHMRNLVANLTQQGGQHFQALREQMNQRFADPKSAVVQSMVDAITQAQTGWMNNRAALLQVLDNALAKISMQTHVPLQIIPGPPGHPASVGLAPNFYLMGPYQ